MTKIFSSIGVVILLAFASVFASEAAVNASTVNEWGTWSIPVADVNGDGSGSLSFVDSNLVDATYDFYNTGSRTAVSASTGPWLTSTTPIGSVFGASGPGSSKSLIRIGQGNTSQATLILYFASPVAAGSLGLAISNLGVVNATVVAYDSNSNAYTGNELTGTASTQAFNQCAVSSPPTGCLGSSILPSITTNANDVVASVSSSGTGASSWYRPSVAVSKIRIDFSGATGQTIDVWVSQSYTPPTPAPLTPLQPSVVAGNGKVTVTPSSPSGGQAVTSYLVTANTGQTCIVTLPAASCDVTGLTNGTAYTFTVTATGVGGTSGASPASVSVTPALSPNPAPTPSSLPETGMNTVAIVSAAVGAALMLAFGLVAVYAARRWNS